MTVVATKDSRKVVPNAGFVNPISFNQYVEVSTAIQVYADRTLLTVGTHYSISGLGDLAGIEITISATGLALDPAPTNWVVLHVPLIDQQADLSVGGSFGAAYESAIDALTRRMQTLENRLERAVVVGVDRVDPAPILPDPVDGSFIAWNSADELENRVAADIGAETLPATASRFIKRNAAGTAFEAVGLAQSNNLTTLSDMTVADQAAAEAGVQATSLMTPQRSTQHYTARKALDADIDGRVEDTKYVTSRGADRAAVIHRNYYDLLKDFGGSEPDNVAVDNRPFLETAFTAIAAAGIGGKRMLYVPKGVWTLDYNTLVSLTPPQGLFLFGDGPEDTILEVVNTTVVGTRTIFQIINSDVTFDKSLTIRMTGANTAVGATWLVASLGGGKSNFVMHAGVEGGTGFLNIAPDNTLTHSVMVLQRQDSLFEGIHVDYGLWNSVSRGYLNDHLQLNAITRRVRFGSRFRATNMYREFIAINAPNVESSDWRFEGGRTVNNWDRSVPASHLAVGNGRDVRIEGWQFEGNGSAIHVEETANGVAIIGNTATLTGTGAKFLRMFANNVGGVTTAPSGLCVIGNRAKTAGATADSRGIYWGNTSLGSPCNNSTFVGNNMSGFERGYSQDESPSGNIVAHNNAVNCTVGFRINTGATASAKALHTYNNTENCGTDYVDAGGGAVPWGTGNT